MITDHNICVDFFLKVEWVTSEMFYNIQLSVLIMQELSVECPVLSVDHVSVEF